MRGVTTDLTVGDAKRGGPSRVPFARLRDALDRLLVNRPPDVQIVTTGVPGVPALVASYAASRGLACVAVVFDFPRHRGNAAARQLEEAVGMADAAVVVLDGCDPLGRDVYAGAKARDIPVFVLAAADTGKAVMEGDSPTPGRACGSPWVGLPD